MPLIVERLCRCRLCTTCVGMMLIQQSVIASSRPSRSKSRGSGSCEAGAGFGIVGRVEIVETVEAASVAAAGGVVVGGVVS